MVSISPGLLLFKKSAKAYGLYACSVGFVMQSPVVLGLCLVAVLVCGVVEVMGRYFH